MQVILNNYLSNDVHVKKVSLSFVLQPAEKRRFFHENFTGILISSSNIPNNPSFHSTLIKVKMVSKLKLKLTRI